MTQRSIAVILLLLSFAGAAAAKPADGSGHGAKGDHKFTSPEEWAKVWDSPERFHWQKTTELLRMLAIRPGEAVADIGAGTGGEGKVFAVDIEPAMLEYIRQRDNLDPSGNVVTVLAEPNDPKLPDGELDLIFTANTWHHIKKRTKYLDRLARALKPTGRLAIVDWRKGELPMGPPDKVKLSREKMLGEFSKAGWEVSSESVAAPYHVMFVLRPPKSE